MTTQSPVHARPPAARPRRSRAEAVALTLRRQVRVRIGWWGWPAALVLTLALISLTTRPPVPPLETRTLSVAWEMWRDGDFLLPVLNGENRLAMPPLAPWLTVLGWSIFGPVEWWPRLLSPLAVLGSVLALRPLARLIWPGRRETGPLAPLLLAGSAGGALASTVLATGSLLLLVVTLASLGVALVWRRGSGAGWLLYGVALGVGLLAAGPLALAFLLPAPLLAPFWRGPQPAAAWGRWYLGFASAVALGAAIALTWMVPAAAALARGSAGHVLALLGGLGDGAAGPSPWPLLLTPLLAYPWPLWSRLWRAVGRQRALLADPGVRYAALAAVPALGFLTAFGDRGLGLLASMPILALLVARLLAHQRPGRADYHALVPGLPLLLIGLVPIALSIVPWSDLEGRVRELFGVTALPMWLRGVTVVSGLVLLGGGFLVVQATPRLMLSRVAQLALLPAVLATAIHLEFLASLNHFFDARPIAARLALHQADGLPAAVLGPYSGEFHYLGRLPADLEQLPDATAAVAWAERNRDGIIVASFAGSMLHLPQQPLFLAPLGPSWIALWPAQTVLESEGRVLAPRF